MPLTSKIKPSLWFPGTAEEAVNFYTTIFPSSRITNISRYTSAGQEEHGIEVGSVMSITFTLHEQAFFAVNGPPLAPFSQAISFTVECEDQEEIDHYWGRLGEGASPLVFDSPYALANVWVRR